MTIIEVDFDNEAELMNWVEQSIEAFLPGSFFMKGFRIATEAGKGGITDGFAFNFSERRWYILEGELISHGVWPHIAEQITRFVVASQSYETKRKVRDRLFEYLIEHDKTNETIRAFETSPERLHQEIELYIDAVDPSIIIFIDDTDEDLIEMAKALSASIEIFRIKKVLIDGVADYYSPDSNVPLLITEPSHDVGGDINELNVLETLGGGEINSSGRFRSYKLQDDSIVHIKRSKFHDRQNYYWYGITTSSIEKFKEHNITHVVFIMGEEGFVNIPLDIVEEFIKNTRTSKNEDGTVRHYHCLISPGPEPELYFSKEIPSFDLSQYYFLN